MNGHIVEQQFAGLWMNHDGCTTWPELPLNLHQCIMIMQPTYLPTQPRGQDSAYQRLFSAENLIQVHLRRQTEHSLSASQPPRERE